MTGLELEKYLKDNLVGKDYNAWCIDSDVLHVIRDYFKEELHWNDKQLGCVWADKSRGNHIEIILAIREDGKYFRPLLAYVEVKKQKGARHYSWGQYSYDWTIKDIKAAFYGQEDTFEARSKEIEKETLEYFNKSKDLETKAKEIGKYLVEKFGNDYEARKVLEELYKNKYSYM